MYARKEFLNKKNQNQTKPKCSNEKQELRKINAKLKIKRQISKKNQADKKQPLCQPGSVEEPPRKEKRRLPKPPK
jgi:hypothetical protein